MTLLVSSTVSLGLGAVHAQPPAAKTEHFAHVTVTPPAGWTRKDASGWALYMPPDVPAGQSVYIGVSPGGESNRELSEEFGAFVRASANGAKVTPISDAKTLKDRQGLATMAQTVEFDDANGSKRYAVLIARRNGNRFESMAFSSTSAQLFQKYAPQMQAFISGMTFDGAPNPAPAPAGDAAPNPPAEEPNGRAANPKAPAAANPAKPTAPPAGAAPVPLANSPKVHKNAKGEPAVANANGKAIAGVPLSRYNADIQQPSITVAPNGTIHVVFIERQKESPYHYFVFHRSSSDGGKTWTEAKNLSEVMPDYAVGTVKVLADAAGRVYAIWRTSLVENFPVAIEPHAAGPSYNLVYRVLENGAWSGKAILVHKPGTKENQNDGSASWFATTGPDGRVHVFWVMLPDYNHPELLAGKPGDKYRQHNTGVYMGSIMQTTLSGTNPGTPSEWFMAPVKVDPNNPQYGHSCDGFDTINGYIDGAGQAHVLAKVERYGDSSTTGNRLAMIENGTETEVLHLPGNTFDTWLFPPTLLIDAHGKRHILYMYTSGEHPEIRDSIVGSDAEPTVIRMAKGLKPRLISFEAFQGPGGGMVALMAMNDSGNDSDAELYVSTSTGNGWSTPVNVTNNTGHTAGFAKATGSRSAVAESTYWYPGPAAAAFDRSGHLALVHVSNEHTVFGGSSFGVQTFGGSTSTPTLLFVHF